MAAYRRLTVGVVPIGEHLALPGAEDVDFEAPPACGLARRADLS